MKRDVTALYFATRDPRVLWVAKAVATCVVAYALSPINLIPDLIPVMGYLDDLVLVPLGTALIVRLGPANVMAEPRKSRFENTSAQKPRCCDYRRIDLGRCYHHDRITDPEAVTLASLVRVVRQVQGIAAAERLGESNKASFLQMQEYRRSIQIRPIGTILLGEAAILFTCIICR